MTAATRRWLARASFALMGTAVALMLAVAGWHSLTLVVLAAVGACAVLVGVQAFLASRGLVRWLGLLLGIAAPVFILVTFALAGLLWVAVASIALMLLAVGAARKALTASGQGGAFATVPAARPRRPVLIMNPWSGGGKVARFGLKQKAERLGAEVVLLEGHGTVDAAALARQAVADGADLLGVAGGDGTQALVAGIAADNDLPFLVISAGTRNHFAMDLGLDRDDPSTCLEALTEGIERRIDLGRIGDRIFVNNASFGVYAELVRSPAYRDDKRGTTLQLLPGLLKDPDGARLTARADNTEIADPQALLISNGPYAIADLAGLGRRPRLETGRLGVVAVQVHSASQAAGLLRRRHGSGLTALTAQEVTVAADAPEIPVGIDGETVMMATPVRCWIRPGVLRVIVPRKHQDACAPCRSPQWRRLRRRASSGGYPPPVTSSHPTQPAGGAPGPGDAGPGDAVPAG